MSLNATQATASKKDGHEIGMPVKAVFNTETPTNTILDLAWIPA